MITDSEEPVLLVVGLGNVQREDDGVGVRLVETIEGELSGGIGAAFWGDSDALSIAHELVECSRPVLFVDCARMGLSPGEWRMFDESSVHFRDSQNALSAHDFGLDYALRLARNLGYRHPVRFFAVEPVSCELRDSLSVPITRRISQLAGELLVAIQTLKVELQRGR